MRDVATPAEHAAIPDEYLQCLITRRHSFPWRLQRQQHVTFGHGADAVQTTEFYGSCEECGATRTMYRERYSPRAFLWADYVYPDGYRPPAGKAWDRDQLWELHQQRHPIPKRARVIDR